MRPLVTFLAQQAPVAISTPWPELYWDNEHVLLVRDHKNLRTQQDNIARAEFVHKRGEKNIWIPTPQGPEIQVLKLSYTQALVSKKKNVFEALIESVRTIRSVKADQLDFRFDIPPSTIRVDPRLFDGCPRKPLALFKLPTCRKEWNCPARNPDPRLWGPLLIELRKTHHIHGVGFLKHGEEWLDGCTIEHCDSMSLYGELRWTEMAAMMKLADICVCAPSNWIPLGLAVGAKLFCVFGGHVAPNALVHSGMIQYVNQWEYVAPDPFCFCVNGKHSCFKQIPVSKALSALKKALCTARPLTTLTCPLDRS